MARTLAMFTDTSLCIGCRACQVACKQWNELGAEPPEWLMSDVCKHCAQAGCLEACPTGAIQRTAYGTVNIDQDLCNGCRYCVASCPFGVVHFDDRTGTAKKCTFCNDRIHNGLGPACAKACPTDSIQFGFRDELVKKAEKRVESLRAMGMKDAQLYGADANGFLGGLNAFFLLLGKPATYNLPDNPKLPQRNVVVDSLLSIGSALVVGLGALLAFRERGKGGDDA
jgi:formate dehydrogenase iron-sulfur subunit